MAKPGWAGQVLPMPPGKASVPTGGNPKPALTWLDNVHAMVLEVLPRSVCAYLGSHVLIALWADGIHVAFTSHSHPWSTGVLCVQAESWDLPTHTSPAPWPALLIL